MVLPHHVLLLGTVAGDIIYDIEHGRLAVEVTADEAAEITTPRPAHAGHHFLTHIT